MINSDEHSIVYDDIGNRQTSTVNAVASAYTANQLNQYTSVRSDGFARSVTHNAFGETKVSGAMKDDFTHWFSTKPLDKETGLIVYQRRYYDPIVGRWLARDPIEEADGPGLRLFLKNDGVNKWDCLWILSCGSQPDISFDKKQPR